MSTLRFAMFGLALSALTACGGSAPAESAPEADRALPVDPAVVGEGAGDAINPDAAPEADPGDTLTLPADDGDQSVDPVLMAAAHATCNSNAHTGDYCAGDKVSNGTTGTLYRCNGPGPAVVQHVCSAGCVTAPAGTDDYCRTPPPPPPPTCNSDAFTGDYCAGDKVSHGVTGTLYSCHGPGAATVAEHCSAHCVVAPPGQDDYCSASAQCPHHSLLRWGLAPAASDELRCAGETASSISQTIGSAPASAGYHAQDGTIGGAPYCAATDLRTSGMSNTQIRALLNRLADGGFAAFYRWPGHDGWPSSESPHIHAVFAGVRMKSELRGQVGDWLHGKNGLATHTAYTFWQPSTAQKNHVRALYNAHN